MLLTRSRWNAVRCYGIRFVYRYIYISVVTNYRCRVAGCLAHKWHCLLYSLGFFTNWWSEMHIWWNVLAKSLVTGVLELRPSLCRPSQDLSNLIISLKLTQLPRQLAAELAQLASECMAATVHAHVHVRQSFLCSLLVNSAQMSSSCSNVSFETWTFDWVVYHDKKKIWLLCWLRKESHY